MPALLQEGKLDRSLRVLRRAREHCPAVAVLGWADELNVLSELGAWHETRELANAIEQDPAADDETRDKARVARAKAEHLDVQLSETDEAKAPMRALYRQAAEAEDRADFETAYTLYLRAWDAWHPNAQALAQAGLILKRLGRRPEAQRLFDRALFEAELATRIPLTLDVPNGLDRASHPVAWSSRGRIAVAQDDYVSLFAQGTLKEVSRLTGLRDGLDGALSSDAAIAFSPDGRYLAIAAYLGARVWDVTAGTLLPSPLAGRVGGASAFAFSPDGTRLATGTQLGDLFVTDTATGYTFREVSFGASDEVAALAFGPKALGVAIGDTLRLIDPDTGVERRKMSAKGCKQLAFSRDGQAIVCVQRAGGFARFDTDTGATIRSQPSPTGGVVAAALSPGAEHAAWALENGTLEVVETTTGTTLLLSQPPTTDRLRWLAFSPDEQHLASAGSSAPLAIIDSGTGRTLRTFGVDARGVRAISFTQDGSALATGSSDGVPHVWNLPGDQRTRLPTLGEPITYVQFTSSSQRMILGSERGLMQLWQTDPMTMLVEAADMRTPTVLADGVLMGISSAAGDERMVVERDATTGVVLGVTGPAPTGDGFAPAPDGRAIAFGTQGADVWDRAQPTRATHLTQSRPGEAVRAVAFSPDGEFALISSESTASLVRYKENKLVRAFATGGGVAAFAPDSSTVIAASERLAADIGSLVVWDVATGEELQRFKAHNDRVTALTFAQGDLLASASLDGSTVVWRRSTLTPLVTLRSSTQDDAGYAFSTDGFVQFFGSDAERARTIPLCRMGPISFPFEICGERFEVKRLLSRLIVGDSSFREP